MPKNTKNVKSVGLRPSISVIVPALNEAGNIKKTVQAIMEALEKQDFSDFELIVIDDGSTDGTEKIVDELAVKNNHIKILHNSTPRGLGYNFRIGISLSSKDYVGWFPGDNETLPETIDAIFEQIGKTDIVIPYTVNPGVRSMYRQLLSSTYSLLFNVIFGLHLKYFNGPCFFRHDLLKTIVMSTDGPAYMAEILIQLVKNGDVSYIEVPMYIKARNYGKASVLKWKNVYLIGKTIISLINKVYLNRSQNKLTK